MLLELTLSLTFKEHARVAHVLSCLLPAQEEAGGSDELQHLRKSASHGNTWMVYGGEKVMLKRF